MEYYKSFTIGDDLLRKSKVEIGKVSFTNWSYKSNFPKNAVIKRYLRTKNRGRDEAQMMKWANLLHPWTVKYYASGVDENNLFYILMENCSKGDLRNKISEKRSQNQPFSVEMLVYYFSWLADIVSVLHKNSIWHRDIKPQNIFINEEEDLRLGDYGISKFSLREDLPYNYHTILGTGPYMSPELKNRKYKENIVSYPDSDDIWALGVTFYEMITFEKISIESDIKLEIRNTIISRRCYPEYFITLLLGMLDPCMPKRWKIEQVSDWLSKCQGINNFRIIYYKTDEVEEEKSKIWEKSNVIESETISIEMEKTSIDFEKIEISNKSSNPDCPISWSSDIQGQAYNKLSDEASSLTINKLEITSSSNPGKAQIHSNEIPDKDYEPSVNILKKLFHKKEIKKKQCVEEKIPPNIEIPQKLYETPIINAPEENKSHQIDEKESILIILSKENEEKTVCRICKIIKWTKLHPQNWRPYKIKCKNCKSHFCSFCNYGGGHKKCREYEDLLLAIKKSIFR